jgi:hypothetical protein
MSQLSFFDGSGQWWEEHWQGMPEFVQVRQAPWKSIFVHFDSEADYRAFAALVKQPLTAKTRYIWYPEAEITATSLRWVAQQQAEAQLQAEIDAPDED